MSEGTSEVSTTYHMSLSVDVDRYTDAQMRKQYRGVLRHLDGRYVEVPGELRKLCAEYRAKGFKCFPPCDNVDETGSCKGHPEVTA